MGEYMWRRRQWEEARIRMGCSWWSWYVVGPIWYGVVKALVCKARGGHRWGDHWDYGYAHGLTCQCCRLDELD